MVTCTSLGFACGDHGGDVMLHACMQAYNQHQHRTRRRDDEVLFDGSSTSALKAFLSPNLSHHLEATSAYTL